MKIELAARTDKGRKRMKNEDRAIAHALGTGGKTVYLLAVADGVGGLPSGDTASLLAVSALSDSETRFDGDPQRCLKASFERAHANIALRADTDPQSEGMATTLVAALLADRSLWIANVGDSRAYLIRRGEIIQITQDHSLVADRVRAGLISEDQAASSPHRSVITRSLGSDGTPDVDIFGCGELESGDSVLLCSDGLYTMVPPTEIADCVSSLKPAAAARELISRANESGGTDNIAVAIARVVSSEYAPASENNNAH